MSHFNHLFVPGGDVPDDQLPVKLGQVYLPPNLHKFLRLKDGHEVECNHVEVFQLIRCFHPSTTFQGNYSNPATLFALFEMLVLPWILGFKSMNYNTNIMRSRQYTCDEIKHSPIFFQAMPHFLCKVRLKAMNNFAIHYPKSQLGSPVYLQTQRMEGGGRNFS
ncbi:hypothetical protein DFH28DRAFT_926903 [Melampsora americana]|nr:hypothetical protein DFH28DRAFT_926903 [Melampsora americana]